jgi:hypothetical protein
LQISEEANGHANDTRNPAYPSGSECIGTEFGIASIPHLMETRGNIRFISVLFLVSKRSGVIGKSIKFRLEWKWPVMGPKLTQTCEERLIHNTARVSCDLLAKNSARTPN